jgi:NAD(P)-dependent dehydrogenase (short-subunit alcohol dehydrogenase family)
MAAYGIAKRGLIQLMQNLAVEWGPVGVRVNAVAPGMTRTPSVTDNIDEASLQKRVRGWPIARLGEPGEIAAAAIFLAAPAAGFVTGHTLVADGGRTLLSGNTSGALAFD